ncbi:MAG: VOC family protein [Clostridiaceae bacterium]
MMSNLHKIFINLPVQDLQRSIDFFKTLGYTFNKQFTNEDGTCLVLGDDIFVMLLVKPFFKGFLTNDVADSKQVSEVIISLSVDSREAVEALVEKALAAGASPSKEPTDMGFMYNRSFLDPDGHHWEVFYMDPNHVEEI